MRSHAEFIGTRRVVRLSSRLTYYTYRYTATPSHLPHSPSHQPSLHHPFPTPTLQSSSPITAS
ncbi:hypothetical protein E2C01_098854 [Portunus trituberculatus]|uniref:Uncharacterized protein n=1 Tax=Portunus trituberculatus TaxID=210409 RepID=A0A5B7KDX4_PORTR|nr:hypothetical protein [Portunus trituberculatus]